MNDYLQIANFLIYNLLLLSNTLRNYDNGENISILQRIKKMLYYNNNIIKYPYVCPKIEIDIGNKLSK